VSSPGSPSPCPCPSPSPTTNETLMKKPSPSFSTHRRSSAAARTPPRRRHATWRSATGRWWWRWIAWAAPPAPAPPPRPAPAGSRASSSSAPHALCERKKTYLQLLRPSKSVLRVISAKLLRFLSQLSKFRSLFFSDTVSLHSATQFSGCGVRRGETAVRLIKMALREKLKLDEHMDEDDDFFVHQRLCKRTE
jgi:hypothetical protein